MTVTVHVMAQGIDTTATGRTVQGTVRRLLGDRRVVVHGGERIGKAYKCSILRPAKDDPRSYHVLGVAIVTPSD